MAGSWLVLGVIAAGAAWVLYRNLWRAVLFLFPSALRMDFDCEPGEIPPSLASSARELGILGFRALGLRCEKPLFGKERLCYEFAHPELRAFATVHRSGSGAPRLRYWTVVQGGFVVTANYRRPAREVPRRYLSGGLENVTAERLLKAHLRRVEPFQTQGEYNAESRLAAARSWWSGLGKGEVREQNMLGLLWSAAVLGLAIAGVIQTIAR